MNREREQRDLVPCSAAGLWLSEQPTKGEHWCAGLLRAETQETDNAKTNSEQTQSSDRLSGELDRRTNGGHRWYAASGETQAGTAQPDAYLHLYAAVFFFFVF
jgi:hypothetical protein